MEATVARDLTPEVLESAAGLYGIAGDALRKLGDFENYVFDFNLDGRDFILRMVHTSHRTPDLVSGEIDWLRYLCNHDIPAYKPIPTVTGQQTGVIPVNGNAFIVSAFGKAPGTESHELQYDASFIREVGRIMGNIHRLTKDYHPPCSEWKRIDLTEDILYDPEAFIPTEETLVKEQCHLLRERLHRLSYERDDYGLIHTDMHTSNLIIGEPGITLIDFDDCYYHWFAGDIAISLFYFLRGVAQKMPVDEYIRMFLKALWSGYITENRIDPEWLVYFPDFLKLRAMGTYSVLLKKFDVENLDTRLSDVLLRYRGILEGGRDIVPFDFGEMIPVLRNM